MCNHYEKNKEVIEWAVRTVPRAKLSDTARLAIAEMKSHTYPKYPAAVITQEKGIREAIVMRWGVWPFYQRAKPQYITNARNDGLLTKALWKNSAKTRRCLVPATGYYEPGLGPPGAKGELRFTPINRPNFFIAGLYDRDPSESADRAFALVTTDPNSYAGKFHDRMPVVLSETDALAWLGEEPLADELLLQLCKGIPAEELSHSEIPAFPKGKITKSDLERAARTVDSQETLF